MADENEDVVGTQNQERVDFRNQLADRLDESRAQEFEDVDGEDVVQEQQDEEHQAEIAEPKKFTIKVNGKEMQLTEEELIARAQKVEAADQYLANAKQQAQNYVKSEPSPSDVQTPGFVEDDLALARVLQMGTEEEAAQAIHRIRNATPSVPVDELASRAVAQIQFKQDAQWFQDEYKDIFADPLLAKMAISLDAEAIQSGDTSPYRDRYKKIGDTLRERFLKGSGISDRAARKAETVTSVKTASVKAQAPVEEEEDDSPQSIIAKMARSRGQI